MKIQRLTLKEADEKRRIPSESEADEPKADEPTPTHAAPSAVSNPLVVIVPPEFVPEQHREEWARLRPGDQRLVTQSALARWASGLADDDYTMTDIVRLERQRQQSLETLRVGAELTDSEWKLLRYLQRHEAKTRTYIQIAHHMWGTAERPITARQLQSLDAQRYTVPMITTIQGLVFMIRKKLEIDPLRPQHLANVRGVGYVWYANPPSLSDGINYEARATEHRQYRDAMYEALGIIEGDFVAQPSRPRIEVNEPGTVRRLALGPEYPEARRGEGR